MLSPTRPFQHNHERRRLERHADLLSRRRPVCFSAVASRTLRIPRQCSFFFPGRWWNEPALNLIAAVAQMSSFTHVELAIGEAVGNGGMMTNVARVFNDDQGVEVTQRTGRNPGATPAPHAPRCRMRNSQKKGALFGSVHVLVARLLARPGAADAALRARPDRQAVQQPGHVPEPAAAEADDGGELVRKSRFCARFLAISHALRSPCAGSAPSSWPRSCSRAA